MSSALSLQIQTSSLALVSQIVNFLDGQNTEEARRAALSSLRDGLAQIEALECTYEASGAAAYDRAIAGGITIISAGNPALNGTYAVDAQAIQNIVAQQISIMTRSTLTNGLAVRNWADLAGTAHAFAATSQFTAFAEACGQYVDALAQALAVAQNGGGWVSPANSFTIP